MNRPQISQVEEKQDHFLIPQVEEKLYRPLIPQAEMKMERRQILQYRSRRSWSTPGSHRPREDEVGRPQIEEKLNRRCDSGMFEFSKLPNDDSSEARVMGASGSAVPETMNMMHK